MKKKLIQKAIDNLFLHEIWMGNSNINVFKQYIPGYENGSLNIQFKDSLRNASVFDLDDHDSYKSLVIFHYECSFRGLPGDISNEDLCNEEYLEGKVIVEVNATFNAAYHLKNKADEEELKAFSENNVAYNIWPYWREYATSVAQRLKLPRFIVPLYKIQDKTSQILKNQTEKTN